MAYAIVRVRKMSTNSHIGGMERHNNRTNNVLNSEEQFRKYNESWSKSETGKLKVDIEQRIEESGAEVRSNSVKAIEYLLTASPEAFQTTSKETGNWLKNPDGTQKMRRVKGTIDELRKHKYAPNREDYIPLDTFNKKGKAEFEIDLPIPERVLNITTEGNKRWQEFKKKSFEWLHERHGKENLVNYSIHYDEKTPHIHAYCVPIIEKTIKYKNRHMEVAKEKHKISLCAKDAVGGLEKMFGMHDTFADKMAPLGLERGKRKSKARHQDIKTYYDRVNSTQEKHQEISSFSPETEKIELPTPPISPFGLNAYREEQEQRINQLVAEKQQEGIQKFKDTFQPQIEKSQEYDRKERIHHEKQAELSKNLDSKTNELVKTNLELNKTGRALVETGDELQNMKDIINGLLRPKTQEEKNESIQAAMNLVDKERPIKKKVNQQKR